MNKSYYKEPLRWGEPLDETDEHEETLVMNREQIERVIGGQEERDTAVDELKPWGEEISDPMASRHVRDSLRPAALPEL